MPAGDGNCFRFEVKRPSEARLTLRRPGDIWIRARLYRSDGSEVADLGCSGETAEGVYRLDPGSYTVDVREWNNNAASLSPFRMRLEEAADDGMDDADQSPGSVRTFRPLPLGAIRGGTVFPAGDRDWYQVTLPSAGVLSAFLLRSPSVWNRLELFDTRGNMLADCGASGERGDLSWHAPGPTTVLLRAREWNDNARDMSPYVVGAYFQPCDQGDSAGRNDAPETATPLELNEWVRGNVLPAGDNDWFRLDVDFPGVLRVEGTTPPDIWTRLSLHDARAEQLGDVGLSTPSGNFAWESFVLPGSYFLRFREWNDNAASAGDYSLRAVLERAEPAESVPLAADGARTLSPGVAASFFIDQARDRDVFMFDVPREGPFWLKIARPADIWLRANLFDDRTGEQVRDIGISGTHCDERIEAAGPSRYRLELKEWNDNGSSRLPGLVQVRFDEASLTAARIRAAADAVTPTLVTFRLEDWGGAPVGAVGRVEVDATGDGSIDFTFPPGQAATWRYPAEGLYRATALMHGEGGGRTEIPFWVDVWGPRERKGIHLTADFPGEGMTVESAAPARVRAISYSGAPIARIEATVDGTPLPPAYAPPYEFEVPWRSLPRAAKEHVMTFTAFDGRGETATLERKFSLSEYFDLRPADGAVLSGNQVRVSWTSGEFSPTRVRYREAGSDEWREVEGESGREHSVVLSDVAPGVASEFQPLGGVDEGPVRSFTRVKGLAFGRSRYGAKIERDYGQRFPISVRNHAESTMRVVLTSGKLEEDGLYIGFVGEGSEGEPFDLAPGEEREFLFVFNAQNVVKERHVFPVNIRSESGYADEAEVEVEVRLPEVRLEWEDLGETPEGPGRRLRLVNRGDSLTDLSVKADTGDLLVSPGVDHGLLPSGGSLEITVRPRLYEGFHEAEGTVAARAVGKEVPFPVRIALPEGREVFGFNLLPASAEGEDEDDRDLLEARAAAAAFLSPEYIDASMWGAGVDSDGDGRVDRWTWIDRAERILWTGEDTDGDGEIDFVRADVGFDGRVDYSAFRGRDGWGETNLLDAWLEMTFTLPWGRGTYEPHDVDIVMNGQVIGRVTDAVPEGNYRFPVPPSAIRFGASGAPEGNSVEIVSRHLRGGHYVVNSDFRLVTRMNAARAWAVAESREAAEQAVRSTEGYIPDRARMSISSHGLSLPEGGKLKSGEIAALNVSVRNLGALPGYGAAAVLSLADPDLPERELARRYIPFLPVTGEVPLRFDVSLPPGRHRLKIVPAEGGGPESAAYIWAEAEGDAQRPTLELISPRDGDRLESSLLNLSARAADDVRVARVEARIDQGLWTRMTRGAGGEFTATGLLQPGEHVLSLRAVDGSGNITETSAKVTVDAQPPNAEILEPLTGSETGERWTALKVRCGPEVAAAAWRVREGPWTGAPVKDGLVEERVPLRFGRNLIEVRLLNGAGVELLLSADVVCTARRAAEEDEDEKPEPGGPPKDGERGEGVERGDDGDEEPALEGEGSDDSGQKGDARRDIGKSLIPGLTRAGMPSTDEAGGKTVREPKPKPKPKPKDEAEDARPPEGEESETPGSVDVPGLGPVDAGGPGNFLSPPSDEDYEESWFAEEEPGEEPEFVPEDVGEGEEEEDEDEVGGDEDWDSLLTETDEFDGLDGLDEDVEPLDMEDWVEDADDLDNPEADPMFECMPEPFDEAGAGPGAPFAPPSGLTTDPGGCVAVETVQRDWYCTNRPHIQVGFRLPDWLKKLDLPKPGTKEYDELIKKLLKRLRDQGIDTGPFERFQEALIRRARMLESPEELPGFLQSLGLASMPRPSPEDAEATRRWREAMENGARAWYLKLLASGDPAMIYEGLKARGEAFGKFDEALGLAADAMMTEIKANQQLTEQVLWSLPYVGPAMDILSIYTGETLSGEAMTPERAAMMLGLRGALQGMIKYGPRAVTYLMNTEAGRTAMAKFAQRTAWMGPAAMDKLSRATGLSEGQLRELASWTWNELTKERRLWGSRAAARAGAAGGDFAASQAGKAAQKNLEKRIADGKKLIDRLQSTTKQKEFDRLVLELQRSKTAVALANEAGVPNALRARINKTLAEISRKVDKHTCKGIVGRVRGVDKRLERFVGEELPKAGTKAGSSIDQFLRNNPDLTREGVMLEQRIQGFLRANPGLKRSEILVRSRAVSGVDPIKLGRDKDVFFQFVTRRGKVLGDVHHDISAPIYNQKLTAATGLTAEQLDHTVTSVWHPDSYNPGRMTSDGARKQMVDDIIGGRAAGRLARPEDIGDTVSGKAKEWFERARGLERGGDASAAAEAWAEGMRQLGKDYGRHIDPFLKSKGLDPAAALPPRLKAALDIFRRVEEGTTSGGYTPEQGLKALESLSCRTPGGGGVPLSPDRAADDMGKFIEMINKWGIQGR
jgi:hypothetical protein